MAESLSAVDGEWLREVRRDLHRHPEPAWREFYTTARIVAEARRLGADKVHVGPEALAEDARRNVPDEAALQRWRERAADAGADPDVLDALEGGATGAVATLRRGEGPTVALRVDIDALAREESTDPDHAPVAGGFRAEHDEAMHACGHDAHATIGLGVLAAVADGDFQGTLKVVFQPGEERIVGGKPVAESGYLDDVDYLFAVHVGLDHPTGEVVAGIDGFLAVRQFRAEFEGEPAHAGARPEEGQNAVHAAASAVEGLYGIPRHGDGKTRVNAGEIGGGTATNIVAESAYVAGETRGETTELREYVDDRARQVLDGAAAQHGCDVSVETLGEAPSAESDGALVDVVADVAADVDGVESVLERDELGGSEDATYLMRRVQDRGGLATYVGVGTDTPGGHHTATFDVDETSLDVGVGVLADAVDAVGANPPQA